MSYDCKGNLQRLAQLKTCELVLPFSITHNATPANKTITNDNPSVLFLKLQGTGQDYTTVANGGFDTSAESSAITFATATDTTGVFNVLVRCGEAVGKVISVALYETGATAIGDTSGAPEILMGTSPTGAPSTFLTSVGDKIVANFDSAVNFATTDYNGYVKVIYTPNIG